MEDFDPMKIFSPFSPFSQPVPTVGTPPPSDAPGPAHIRDPITTEVDRVNDPAYDSRMEAAYVAWAESLESANAPATFQPSVHLSHHKTLSLLLALDPQIAEAQDEIKSKEEKEQQAHARLATIPDGWRVHRLISAWAPTLLVWALVVLAMGLLLHDTIILVMKLPYVQELSSRLENLFRNPVSTNTVMEELALARSMTKALSFILPAAVTLPPTLLYLLAGGRSRYTWLFLISDFLFAGAFFVLRHMVAKAAAASTASLLDLVLPALAFSLFEFAIVLAHLLYLAGLSKVWQEENQQHQKHRIARSEHHVAQQAVQRAVARRDALFQQRDTMLRTLKQQEEDAAQHPARVTLARDTARLAYRTATQRLEGAYLEAPLPAPSTP